MAEQNEPLSEREIEILRLVATGAANKEIAHRLAISPNTVKVHLRNIFSKIGVVSRTEATLYALQAGLVQSGAENTSVESDRGSSIPEAVVLQPADAGQPSTLTRWLKPWQIALALLLALGLIGSGVAGARLLLPSALSPTVASQAVTSQQAANRWSNKGMMPEPAQGMGIAEYEGAFYLVGGETPAGVSPALLRYNLVENTWETLPDKPTPVTSIQAALLNEKIFVPGGRLSDGSESRVLEAYNPRQDNWEVLAQLPAPVSGYALASFEGMLYLFGGKSGSQILDCVYVYDPQADQWEERSPMSAPRAFASAVVMGNKIFVMGGFDGQHALKLNETYFPTRDAAGETAWETRSPLPAARYGMGAAHLAGQIYLLGGLADENAQPDSPLIQYLADTDEWSPLDQSQEPVGAFPASLGSGNFLYTFGGQTDSGLSASLQSYQAIYTISVPILLNDN